METANHAEPGSEPDLDEFLRPLDIDVATAHRLSRELYGTFRHLAAHSLHQFLPTPISESILRPVAGREKGLYVRPLLL